MRRRLRKKKRMGEFRELGFEICAGLTPDMDDSGFERFLDRLIDFVEARQLAFGGGGRSRAFEGFVVRPGRGSASDEDRFALGRFLEADSGVLSCAVGPLVDAWR